MYKMGFEERNDNTRVSKPIIYEPIKSVPYLELVMRKSKESLPQLVSELRSKLLMQEDHAQGKAKEYVDKLKKLRKLTGQILGVGAGLVGLGLIQGTPIGPYVDAALATHSGYNLAEQADKGTLGFNTETGLNTLGLIPMGINGVTGLLGKISRLKPGFGLYNWFTKKFYPYKAKRLDELQHQRLFIKEHPYEYVSDKVVKDAISKTDDGHHLYRGVNNDRGIPYSRIKTEPNYSTHIELIDPNTDALLYTNTPSITAWTSIKPDYVRRLNSLEIHIQPIKDFTFVKPQITRRAKALYMNAYDKNSRIVNASGFNLESGDHFIKIPSANSYARMREGINYNTSSYKSPLLDYSVLFPGINRNVQGWNIHKGYKLAAMTPGMLAGVMSGVGWAVDGSPIDVWVNIYKEIKRLRENNENNIDK